MMNTRGYRAVFLGYSGKDNHVEYQMKILDHLDRSRFISRRYREFRELHDNLKLLYPDEITWFPPKRYFGNRDPQFVETRQRELQKYMQLALSLDPRCTKSGALRSFLDIAQPTGSEDESSFAIESLSQRVTQMAKTRMLDLSLSAEQYLESLDQDNRERVYAQMISGQTDARRLGPTTGIPPLQQPISPRLMKVAERYNNLPQFANLSEERWKEIVITPSLVANGDAALLEEALRSLVKLTDPKRPIPEVKLLRQTDFPLLSSHDNSPVREAAAF